MFIESIFCKFARAIVLGVNSLDNRYFKGYGSSQKNLLDYPVGVFGLNDTNQEDSPEKRSSFAILIRSLEVGRRMMTILIFCQDLSNVQHKIWVKGGDAEWEGMS